MQPLDARENADQERFLIEPRELERLVREARRDRAGEPTGEEIERLAQRARRQDGERGHAIRVGEDRRERPRNRRDVDGGGLARRTSADFGGLRRTSAAEDRDARASLVGDVASLVDAGVVLAPRGHGSARAPVHVGVHGAGARRAARGRARGGDAAVHLSAPRHVQARGELARGGGRGGRGGRGGGGRRVGIRTSGAPPPDGRRRPEEVLRRGTPGAIIRTRRVRVVLLLRVRGRGRRGFPRAPGRGARGRPGRRRG